MLRLFSLYAKSLRLSKSFIYRMLQMRDRQVTPKEFEQQLDRWEKIVKVIAFVPQILVVWEAILMRLSEANGNREISLYDSIASR